MSGDAVYVDLNDSGSDVEFSKRYDQRPMSDAAGPHRLVSLALRHKVNQLGRRSEAPVREPAKR